MKKYTPNLQNIVCFQIHINIINKTFINEITLLKDRILLGENEFIKYDYIANFVRGSNNTLIINTFTDINIYSKELIVSDCITSIIIELGEPVAKKTIVNCMDYIMSYKKYNSFDKSVKNFRCFKILFYK